MIIRIGSDIVNIQRIEKSLQRFGNRFIQHCFTEAEQDKCNGSPKRAAAYAKRFAAKEAFSKALGTGFMQGVSWRDMSVINLPGGKPVMLLSGSAARHLASLTPAEYKPIIRLTISDEFPLAQASVIIEIEMHPNSHKT